MHAILVARKIAFENCKQEICIKSGIKNEKGIGYRDALRYFKDSTDKSIPNLGEDLSSLMGNRVDADYNMAGSCSRKDAADSFTEAQIFLDILSKIPVSSIGEAMEKDK